MHFEVIEDLFVALVSNKRDVVNKKRLQEVICMIVWE